jgi:hypothetical protein
MRGAQAPHHFKHCVCVVLKYADTIPEAALTDMNSEQTSKHNAQPKLPTSHQTLRPSAEGRRQHIPSSPIHISKNKPDQPAINPPVTGNQPPPVQNSFSIKPSQNAKTHQSAKANQAGGRNLLASPTRRKKNLQPPRR